MNNKNIVVVDNSSDVTEVLTTIIDSKYNFITILNDENSVDNINTIEDINLIIINAISNKETSYRSAYRLKQDILKSEIAIIFIIDDINEVESVFKYGAADYILKPCNSIELSAKIKNTLKLFNLRNSLSNALEDRQRHIVTIERQLKVINKNVLFIKFDIGKRVTQVSQAYIELLECADKKCNKESFNFLNSTCMSENLLYEVMNSLQISGFWRGHLSVQTAKKNELWLEISISEDLDYFGDVVGYIATITNDTDKKTIEKKSIKLDELNEQLEENNCYLRQFRRAIEEASIFSITDEYGVIKEVNKNFEDISGYTEAELVGQPHNIVRHKESPPEVFRDMWRTIKSGNIWKGLVKNRRKNGKAYHVLSEIAPIYYKNGEFKEYIGIRTDVSELEEYKIILKHELDTKSKNLEESLNYTLQYENAINSLTAILKTDTNNTIKYANSRLCELSGYSLDELLGKNWSSLRNKKHMSLSVCHEIAKKLSQKQSTNMILTNSSKSDDEYIVNTLFYPVLNLDGDVIEHLHVMYDVTEIFSLNQEIVDTQKEVVLTMGAIGETRSKETGLHVKRVAEYSYTLAKLAGLSEDESAILKQASPMHDIGKVGIPDEILNKPAKLTKDEFDVMKTHAALGYEMLKHSQRDILKTSAIVAYTHHEKYDGSGYPNALSGEDIHIYGRITAIADVFDALGHDRVYKKAWDDERIFKLFKEESGKHFDPNLIKIFFDNLDDFLYIKEKFKDE
ncbi:MAG: PAS domain S-box protein [Campylobacterota bacterium]|nr:PAS domain S-box protein [Campylobacterota bacterium]